ncbi:MAG: RNA polymerase sigma factor [Bacteroidaceae bacterium]|jgi:RNA polymerase sigma-70 factor (ECF subfamily)
MQQTEFNQTATQLRPFLLGLAKHYLGDSSDAEDAVQEGMLKLWILRLQIDNKEKMAHFGSVVVKNICLNVLRKSRTEVALEEVMEETSVRTPYAVLEEHENNERLKVIVHALPDKYRAVIKMRNVDGLSYQEIAEVMGCSESATRVLLSRARHLLMEKIEKFEK